MVAKLLVGMHPTPVVVASDGRTAFISHGGDNTVGPVTPQRNPSPGVVPVGAVPHGVRTGAWHLTSIAFIALVMFGWGAPAGVQRRPA